ncbi:MAG: CHRD domain-containing protein [Nitrospiraceae bacterium]|nr:CHRD domain-containing protein [Nitrospiraceae bacterium]
MKAPRRLLILVTALAIVFAGASAGAFKLKSRYAVKLSGKQETPAVSTKATGVAYIRRIAHDTKLTYVLKVRNIEGVTMAHIHLAPKGQEGPPVANLYTGPEKKGKFSGTLAKGTITDKDLTGPMQGKTINDLIKEIKGGNTYINVHTAAHPNGEIRGQIK